MHQHIKVLCFGDVVGKPGRDGLREKLTELRKEFSPDLVVVNAENSAGGLGITPQIAEEIRSAGAQVITLGDHTWQKKEIKPFLQDQSSWIIRPENYPAGAPGRGWTIWTSPSGVKVGVMNLIGRVFFNSPLDCPFRAAQAILEGPLAECRVILCDMHAEATSEKVAMGRYLDGRVSLVFGTHTHVQTADEEIFPGGTAFMADVGMCGARTGVIGMRAEVALDRFLAGLPLAYEVAEGPVRLGGLLCEIDSVSGKALRIQRLRIDM